MNIKGMVHVNINCSDFERSRAFYEKLGFEVLLVAPEDSTSSTAGAMGMDEYQIKAAIMVIRGTRPPVVIDLIEWRTPRDLEPPFTQLNHLGIARLALSTSDMDADLAELRAAGVEIVGEPATVEWDDRPNSRFVCFKDPDGTVLELLEDV